MNIFRKWAQKILKDALRKQGLDEHWGWHFVEYSQPYRQTAYHAMGVGGTDAEGKFAVPGKVRGYTQAPDGKIVAEDWRIVYDRDILSGRKAYTVGDELKGLAKLFAERVGRKRGG